MNFPDESEIGEDKKAEHDEKNEYTVKQQKENIERKWYILRVQSGKEDRVKNNLEKRVIASNLQDVISDVVVPSELVSEIKKGNNKRVVERKLYPGYVMVEMALTDDAHFLVKSTPGVGDFVGTPHPIPMSEEEVERMLANCSQVKDKPKPKVSFKKGQNIKIKEGPFENFDGIVDEVNEQKGIVKVVVTIFGRYTQVELEYWQVESL